MQRYLPHLLGCVLLASAATDTMAQTPNDSWYFGLDAGLTDLEVTGRPSQVRVCDAVECSTVGLPNYGNAALRLTGVVGTRIAENVRVDGELFVDVASAEAHGRAEGGFGSTVSGAVRTYGLMLNGWLDLDVDASWNIYLGGGAGMLIAQTSYHHQSIVWRRIGIRRRHFRFGNGLPTRLWGRLGQLADRLSISRVW